jgi:hypothetical protein
MSKPPCDQKTRVECLAAQPTAYLSQSGPLSIVVEKFAGAAEASRGWSSA